MAELRVVTRTLLSIARTLRDDRARWPSKSAKCASTASISMEARSGDGRQPAREISGPVARGQAQPRDVEEGGEHGVLQLPGRTAASDVARLLVPSIHGHPWPDTIPSTGFGQWPSKPVPYARVALTLTLHESVGVSVSG